MFGTMTLFLAATTASAQPPVVRAPVVGDRSIRAGNLEARTLPPIPAARTPAQRTQVLQSVTQTSSATLGGATVRYSMNPMPAGYRFTASNVEYVRNEAPGGVVAVLPAGHVYIRPPEDQSAALHLFECSANQAANVAWRQSGAQSNAGSVAFDGKSAVFVSNLGPQGVELRFTPAEGESATYVWHCDVTRVAG